MTEALLAAIVLLAFIVEATTGFGATIVTVTLAAQLLPIPEVLGAFVPVNVLLSAYLVATAHDAIAWRLLGRLVLPFMGAGVAAGLALAHSGAGQGVLRLIFAAFVVALALRDLVPAPAPAPLTPLRARVALGAAGVIHGLFACGGPLAVYVIGRELPEKRAFRCTLAVVWLAFNAVLLPSYALAGDLGAASLRRSAILVAPLVLGILIGERLHDRIAPRHFRLAVSVILLAGGAVLLVRSL